jgi:hypothetical protein
MAYRCTAIYYFPRTVFATSVLGLTFLPVARFFRSVYSATAPKHKEATTSGGERASGRILGKPIGLEIVKRAVRISSGLRKTNVWTLWRVRPPPKRKQETTHRVGAGSVGAEVTLGIFGPNDWK